MTEHELTRRELDAYRRLRHRVTDWLQTRAGQQSRWADYVLLVPDFFHLMTRLALDPEVPAAERVKLAAAVAYFVSPANLIPEAVLGPMVLSGDLALAAYVVSSVIVNAGPSVVRRHWAGEEDVLNLVNRVIGLSERWLNSGRWQHIRYLVYLFNRRRA